MTTDGETHNNNIFSYAYMYVFKVHSKTHPRFQRLDLKQSNKNECISMLRLHDKIVNHNCVYTGLHIMPPKNSAEQNKEKSS